MPLARFLQAYRASRRTLQPLFSSFASGKGFPVMKRAPRILVTLLLMLVSVSASLAQVTAVPPLMNFQGRLTKPDGTPVADGEHTLTFRLFSAASGGSALWSHTMAATVRNGTFAVLLGAQPERNRVRSPRRCSPQTAGWRYRSAMKRRSLRASPSCRSPTR